MRRLFLKLFRRRRLRRDLDAELAFHREMASAGGNPIPLGNASLIDDQALDLWRFNWIENLGRDLHYAFRGLRRSPTLVFGALLSLGLGIGANTTIFSLAVELLMSEPSVTDPRSLALLRAGGNSHESPEVVEFLRTSGAFADVAGQNEESFINWNDGSETRRLFAMQTTKNYFTALGIPVALGRGWRADDPNEVAVLRHQFWRTHFNADPGVIGSAIRLDGRAYTVLGVLPESHRTLVGYGFSPDIYVPRYLDKSDLAMYVRLRPGMSLGAGRAAAATIIERIQREVPGRRSLRTARAQLRPVSGMARFEEDGTLAVGLFFVTLLVLSGLVLLIACVNVAGLLLARSAARRQEIAIRLALGASRGRLLQQLLSESLLLSIAGAGFGFFLAYLAAKSLAALPLPVPIPIHLHIAPDWRVASYAALLAIVSTIACGLVPAWQTVRDSLVSNLRRERRLRLRRALVVAQIAVSFIVLVTGGLFLRNLFRSAAIGPGFDVYKTARAEVHLPPSTYRGSASIAAYSDRALAELRAIPGVEAAAAARNIPFTDITRFGGDLTFLDNGAKTQASFHWNAVSPDYFRAMDIRILAGRAFSSEDRGRVKAVVVNDVFVRRYLGGRDPVGVQFLWGEQAKTPHQIAGVAHATKLLTLGEDDQPQLYELLSQIRNERTRIQFVVRSATPPAGQLAAIRQALRRVEPAAGLEVATLFSSIGLAFLPSQVGAVMMGGVGSLGLLLAAVGLYGVLAYSVARRAREIGVRIAIGATRGDISRMVLSESVKLLAFGMAIGAGISFLAAKPLAMFLAPGLSTSDPASFLCVFAVLTATGILAAFGPMRRATRIDPADCLRSE